MLKFKLLKTILKVKRIIKNALKKRFGRYYLVDSSDMTVTRIYCKHFERRVFIILFVVTGILVGDWYLAKMSKRDEIYNEMKMSYEDSLKIMHDSLAQWPIIENITNENGVQKIYEYAPTQQEIDKGVNINAYDREIKYASQIYDIPEAIIKAVISVESTFDPNAVSSAGAKGLMQVMPSNYEHLRITNPHDAYDIIMGGSQFLKGLYVRYGDWNKVFKYYNGGAAGLSENPPTETVEYVKKINARLKVTTKK